MRAVLIATWEAAEENPTGAQIPAALAPLVDRPFIQHVVETLAVQGVRQIDLVQCQAPERLRRLLEEGQRWGIEIRYHLVRDPERPYAPLRSLAGDPNEPLLLVHGDRLFATELREHMPDRNLSRPVLYCHREVDPAMGESELPRPCWNGWAWLPADCCRAIPAEAAEAELFDYLQTAPHPRRKIQYTSRPWSVHSYRELLEAHWEVLQQHGAGLLITGREVEPGIWLSRNVTLHPTARLTPPVYVGRDCRIEQGVRLGPRAVIGHQCIIDRKSTITETVIFPGSYVGEGLELHESVVDRNRLVNTRIGSSVTVTDNFILGSLAEKHFKRFSEGALSRLLAAALLIPAAPLLALAYLLLALFRSGPVVHRDTVIRLPAGREPSLWRPFTLYSFQPPAATAGGDADGDPLPAGGNRPSWRDLILRVLPGLYNVLRGEARFVGVRPLAAEEIRRIPADWQALYLESKPGLITEAMIKFGPHPHPDDLYSAEAVYAVSAGYRYDFRLVMAYVGQIIGLSRRPEGTVQSPRQAPPS